MLQNATPLRKSAPWPPNISDKHVPCTAPATRHASLQILCKSPFYILTWTCALRRNGVPFFDISTSNVVRPWCVLYILASNCASRHNGVQFFISHLARWLHTRRFSEPTFRPSGATNHWKNKVFRDFPTFSRTCIFFLLTLSLLWSSLFCSSLLRLFPPLLFHLSILSEVWLLDFLRLIFVYIYIYIIYIVWIADKMTGSFSCHEQIGGRPYRLWRFLGSQTLKWFMPNGGICIRLSPVSNEGFAHPSARPRRSKTKSVSQQLCRLLIKARGTEPEQQVRLPRQNPEVKCAKAGVADRMRFWFKKKN